MNAASKLREWREHPITFVREVLRAEPDAWQAEFLQAFATRSRLALKACKGPGKSTALAWVGWNFLLTRPHPKVVATSISGDNLRDNLWTELSKWQQKSEMLKAKFTWGAERIVCNDHPETWWASARQWSKSADASQQANTLAGIHADFVLFLVDEAGGIPDAVVATAEGGLANADPERGTEAKLVLAGNPTHLEGPLYRACTRERSLWWVKEISSAPDDPSRTPRVSRQWAQEQIDKYGADSPWVLVNVFGEFPPGQSNTLIGVEDATKATRRSVPESGLVGETRIMGVDVANFGDDRTVFWPRQGPVAFKPKVFRNLDDMEIADRVAWSIDRWNPDAVFIDATGVGAGVVSRLRQLKYSCVMGVHNSGSPLTAEPKLLNRRSEQWWNMAQWLRNGGCIPDDAELIQEMTAPTFSFNAQSKLQIEAKADIKKRLGYSPDKADALALTFAAPVASKLDARGMPRQTARCETSFEPYPERVQDGGARSLTEFDPYGGI